MAGKSRRPERGAEREREAEPPARAPTGRGPEVQPPVSVAADRVPAALSGGGQPRAELLAQALSVAPRVAELTEHLVETVSRSGLPEERKVEIRDRLLADQRAADAVAAAVVRAFGRDDPALRAGLTEGARRATDDALAEAIAAHTGHPVPAVQRLCHDLDGWVASWWREDEDEEEAPPGDYAAEESGT